MSTSNDTTVSGQVRQHHETPETVAEPAAIAAGEAVIEKEAGDFESNTADEAAILKSLTEGVRDQDDIQRDISHRANQMLIKKEDERDQKRINKAVLSKEKLIAERDVQKRKLDGQAPNTLRRSRLQTELDSIDNDIATFGNDIVALQLRMESRHQHEERHDDPDQHQANRRFPNEPFREFLIRTGKITPFAQVQAGGAEGISSELTETLMDAEDEAINVDLYGDGVEPKSHQNLRLPGFAEESGSGFSTPAESEFSLRPRKKRRLQHGSVSPSFVVSDGKFHATKNRGVSVDEDSAKNSTPGLTDTDLAVPIDEDSENMADIADRKKKATAADAIKLDLTGIDDGNEKVYQSRLRSWVERRSRARQVKQKKRSTASGDAEPTSSVEQATSDAPDDEAVEEWLKPSPDAPDHHFENGLKLPGDIYQSLFDYQKTGVQWLGELYAQQVGGIIGDEMGLGKTIQTISFLAGLHYSKALTKPVIVVAPATVLQQWVNEFHRWWPPLRVSILHTSGSGMLNLRDESRIEEHEESFLGRRDKKPSKSQKLAKRIVDRVAENGHVLITTYAGLQTYGDILIPVEWGYAVLDEGHKIRNPNTAVTVYCKELQTANRIILSGTPMQNNLIELWSLFDFVYPMRLGTLVDFRGQFEVPIRQGGYANATNLEIMTATKCAETLKDAISPYLLQRLKADVAADLPKKTEQVLFCKLTRPQREAYETFLASAEMTSIYNGKRQSLFGIDILRKICNHPDLLDPSLRNKPDYKWGNPHKSGKMQVLKALLEIWKRNGDKALLFSQGKLMLNVLEEFVKSLPGLKYIRMDGGTSIKDRQSLVDRFNNDPELHVFLLTTKVGGLGVNLTGANRVIIFDPDWNPSTDVQARERAWRLGQKKEVAIYRLMIAGTIEEKMYHRQIFKQFLADKVLKDPKQRQTFELKDLYDLFKLGSSEGTTETGEMFEGSEVQLSMNGRSASGLNNRRGGPSVPGSSTRGTRNTIKFTAPNIEKKPSRIVDKEVLDITGVASLESFRDGSPDARPSTDETRIMEGIFARSGVHSVLHHEQIINGKRVVAANRAMLEREAKRVAAEAAAELRRAGEAARNIPIGTVTWTGEVGEAGRPVNIRRGTGPSSAGILANLAKRQGLTPGSAGSSRSRTPQDEASGPRSKNFMKLIIDYIRSHGGSVPTQMLVVHFDNMCKAPQQSIEFKEMLQKVAALDRGATRRGRGRWTLNDEFK